MYHTGSKNLRRLLQGSGKFKQWCSLDIIEYLEPLLSSAGYYINERGKITRKGGLAWNTPWVHVVAAPNKRCNLDHNIIFNNFEFIPKRCHECWKVVVSPRTLSELMQLETVERELGLPSKCGIEIRSYTPRLYGGYFYCDSLEHGRSTYKTVREAVSDAISPDISVILKRGCTEYELIVGPSPYWVITPEHEELERRIEQRVELPVQLGVNQPDYVIDHVKKRWVEWAYAAGDETYKEFTGGEAIYPDTVKYHEGKLEEIKADLARARTAKLYQADMEAINGLLTDIGSLMEKHHVNPAVIGTALGHHEFNPLFIGEHDDTT